MSKKRVSVEELTAILGHELTEVVGAKFVPPRIERHDGCDPNWSVPIAKDSEYRAAVERVMAMYELE